MVILRPSSPPEITAHAPRTTGIVEFPKPKSGAIDDLVRALIATSTQEGLERGAALQIGGQASGRKVRPEDVETLYIIFDDPVQERLQALQQQ